jgi:peptidoglycan/xylan/chitin deacetylase (PgdA/CDA1 family)
MAPGVLSNGAAWIPLEWVRPLSGVTLVVPFYHMVSDDHVPHVSNLYRFRSVAEFKADVEYLARRFTPVSLQDIVDALNGIRALPPSCFHLTFDDGFREMHEVVAPILQGAGIPATFFLITAFLDGGGLSHYNALSVLIDRLPPDSPQRDAIMARLQAILPPDGKRPAAIRERLLSIGYSQEELVPAIAEILDVDLDQYVRATRPHLSSGEVEALASQGFSIGSHSIDHPLYGELSLEDQLGQTRASMEFLEKRFGAAPKAFAFPHNDDGVADEFFDAIFSKGMLDVSFGTSGLVAHRYPRNIQRVSMEKTPASCARILSKQFARATYRRLRARKEA